MGQVCDTGDRRALARRQRLAASVGVQLDHMRAHVDAEVATFGTEIGHCYAMERLTALLAGDWSGFRHADDKLTYLRCLAG